MTREVQSVDALELFRRSRRFDLIYKVELAHAWAYGTPDDIRIAEDAYLEHIRAHNAFCEKNPLRLHPFDFIRDAFRTLRSIFKEGYNPNHPIPLSSEGELLGGAHRLAACVAYNQRCFACYIGKESQSVGNAFTSYLKSDIHPAVLSWGIRSYLKRVPDGRISAEFPSPLVEIPFPDLSARPKSMRGISFPMKVRKKLFCRDYPIPGAQKPRKGFVED